MAESERNRREVSCVSELRSLPHPFLGKNAMGTILLTNVVFLRHITRDDGRHAAKEIDLQENTGKERRPNE